jgi:ketosteroid isomerase-like protein
MKKHLIYLLMMFCLGIFSLTGCREHKSFSDQEKQAIRDTIFSLSDEVIGYAQNANIEGTFKYLSEDSAAVFISGGMVYNREEIISRFTKEYNAVKAQKIEPIDTRVIVFSPTSAAWISVCRGHIDFKDETTMDQLLTETWIWQREAAGWKVVHYHETYLTLPDDCRKATVENGVKELAKSLAGKDLKPEDMPAILTNFLKLYPEIYGSTLAFAPSAENGNVHRAAPYIYRFGKEFKQVSLPESYDYTVSEWYAVPVGTKKPAWSNPYFDDGGGQVVMITYSLPVYDKNNNLIGVLTGDLEVK